MLEFFVDKTMNNIRREIDYAAPFNNGKDHI